MPRIVKKKSKKSGLAPGVLVHIGDKKESAVRISVIDYDEKDFQQKEFSNIEECFSFKDSDSVSWLNIDGLHQLDIIEKIGTHFNIHPLVMEDIVNTDQRPKHEEHDDYLYIALKMLYFADGHSEVQAEQISLIVTHNCVISFQEKEGDIFDPVRERIKSSRGRIRKMGSDYLAYTLIDIIVDNYFLVLEKIEEKIELIESELDNNPTKKTLHSIYQLKRDNIFLRKTVWPIRELVNALRQDESAIIKESTHIFLKDVYDHTIHTIDAIDSYRDIISGMLDIYLSIASNKMNEVMKVLTIIATIFIPMTFIAGVYGMNFEYMPELKWRLGYFGVWGVMASIFVFMLIYFKRKKWL